MEDTGFTQWALIIDLNVPDEGEGGDHEMDDFANLLLLAEDVEVPGWQFLLDHLEERDDEDYGPTNYVPIFFSDTEQERTGLVIYLRSLPSKEELDQLKDVVTEIVNKRNEVGEFAAEASVKEWGPSIDYEFAGFRLWKKTVTSRIYEVK